MNTMTTEQHTNMMVAVAIDAFLDGHNGVATRTLKEAGLGLSRKQAKQIAKLLNAQGRIIEALFVLTLVFTRETALGELAPAPTAAVGDILYTSWGYDQTTVDYYMITAVSGSSATLQQIGATVIESSHGSDTIAPDASKLIGKPLTKKRVQRDGSGGYQIKVDHHHAWQWDGKPNRETSSGWGH